MMKLLKTSQHAKHQQGAAVMLFSAVLLLGITTSMIYSARTSIMEQKVTANQIRAKQARQVNNSGLSAAMIAITRSMISTTSTNKKDLLNPDTQEFPTAVIPGLGSYNISYNALAVGDTSDILVTIKAKSEDGTGLRDIQQVFRFQPFVKTIPPATLVSEGDVVLDGPTVQLDNVSNKYTTVTLACGRTMKRKNKAKTAKTSTTLAGTAITKRRVMSGLATTNSMPQGDALFESFFIDTKTNIKKRATVINCGSTCGSNDIAGLSGLVWVEGNLNMNSNKPAAGKYVKGSVNEPIVLIVNGDFKMSHNKAQVNGLVYVTQDWNNNGVGANGKVRGSVIVEGNVSANGQLSLAYNDTVLDSVISNIGMYIPLPGTWQEI